MIKCICIIIIIIILSYLTYNIKEKFEQNDFLTIICRVKNEHFMMKSFIPYYLSQGVDKIYLIDDNSYHPYRINNDKVEIIKSERIRKKSHEMMDVNRLYKKIRNRTKWVMCIDADEFIYSKKGTIRYCLERYFKDADCVFVPWVFFSFEGRQYNGEDIINDYVYRWNHDRRHDHPNNDHKNRCRYNFIECKAIFKTKSFKNIKHSHKPTNPVKKNPEYRESVYNTYQEDIMFPGLREKDIKNAIMVCNHYRFSSVNNIINKCDKSSIYKHYRGKKCVENCLLSDYNEVYDDTLKRIYNK